MRRLLSEVGACTLQWPITVNVGVVSTRRTLAVNRNSSLLLADTCSLGRWPFTQSWLAGYSDNEHEWREALRTYSQKTQLHRHQAKEMVHYSLKNVITASL